MSSDADWASVSTDLLADLDDTARVSAALRAIVVMPDRLRSQGARICLFAGYLFLARTEVEEDRARAGLARAIVSVTVLRDLYADGRLTHSARLHPRIAEIVRQTVRPKDDLVPAIDAFLFLSQRILDTAVPDGSLERDRYGALMDSAFERLLPAISDLMDRNAAAVDGVWVKAEADATDARQQALDAIRQIERLTRIVRIISVNARVEAARAGPAGRTFAVIADEVTDFAENVDRASGDIADRIEAMVASYEAI